MGAPLGNHPVLKNVDVVAVLNGSQPVGNANERLAGGQPTDGRLNDSFALRLRGTVFGKKRPKSLEIFQSVLEHAFQDLPASAKLRSDLQDKLQTLVK